MAFKNKKKGALASCFYNYINLFFYESFQRLILEHYFNPLPATCLA